MHEEVDEELRRLFTLGPVLGRGGMGVVYEARQLSLDRPVALKLVSSLSEADRARFAREAQSLATLRHPCLIEVYDAGTGGRTPWIAMELMRAPTLEASLAAGPLPIEEVVSLVDAMCQGIQHAHTRGIVHRDLKPANVFVCGPGSVKVSDFGLARTIAKGQTVTEAGLVIGTPAYMAPELFLGERSTPAADQYALGLMVATMLLGREVHHGMELSLMVKQRLEGVPLGLGLEGVRGDHLEKVLRRATAREPADRFPDLEALRHALAAAAGRGARSAAVTRRVVTGVSRPAPATPGRRGARSAALAFLALLALLIGLRPGAVPPAVSPTPAESTATASTDRQGEDPDEVFVALLAELRSLHELYHIDWAKKEQAGLVHTERVSAESLDTRLREPLYQALNVGRRSIDAAAAATDPRRWIELTNILNRVFASALTQIHEFQNNALFVSDVRIASRVAAEEAKLCKLSTPIHKRLLEIRRERKELAQDPAFAVFRENLRLTMLWKLRHLSCADRHDAVMTASADELAGGLVDLARILRSQAVDSPRHGVWAVFRMRALLDLRSIFGAGRPLGAQGAAAPALRAMACASLDHLEDILEAPAAWRSEDPYQSWFLVVDAAPALLDAESPPADRARAESALARILERLPPEPGGLAKHESWFPRKGGNPDQVLEKLRRYYRSKGKDLPALRN